MGSNPCAGVAGCISTVRITVEVTANAFAPSEGSHAIPVILQAWLSESGR
jgi:hypothetical protein